MSGSILEKAGAILDYAKKAFPDCDFTVNNVRGDHLNSEFVFSSGRACVALKVGFIENYEASECAATLVKEMALEKAFPHRCGLYS